MADSMRKRKWAKKSLRTLLNLCRGEAPDGKIRAQRISNHYLGPCLNPQADPADQRILELAVLLGLRAVLRGMDQVERVRVHADHIAVHVSSREAVVDVARFRMPIAESADEWSVAPLRVSHAAVVAGPRPAIDLTYREARVRISAPRGASITESEIAAKPGLVLAVPAFDGLPDLGSTVLRATPVISNATRSNFDVWVDWPARVMHVEVLRCRYGWSARHVAIALALHDMVTDRYDPSVEREEVSQLPDALDAYLAGEIKEIVVRRGTRESRPTRLRLRTQPGGPRPVVPQRRLLAALFAEDERMESALPDHLRHELNNRVMPAAAFRPSRRQRA